MILDIYYIEIILRVDYVEKFFFTTQFLFYFMKFWFISIFDAYIFEY